MKNILIVGGGTAGWMTALHLAHTFAGRGLAIRLIEWPMAPSGSEGATPLLREFFDRLRIPETTWMPECLATYKCGTRFPDWSTHPGFESYLHPCFGELDHAHFSTFREHCMLRREGHEVPAHPDDYFLASALVSQGRSPVPQASGHPRAVHGYHLDADLLGAYLRRLASERGVQLLHGTPGAVRLHENGDIAAVSTVELGELEADFFIDCSGSEGLLIRQALREPLVSLREYLANDSALVLSTPAPDPLKLAPQTVVQAMPQGWISQVPLMGRMDHAFVYCAEHFQPGQAEQELRVHLGALADSTPARSLHWQPGRLQHHWSRNCLAVGASQGQLEPLEGQWLELIQRTVEAFQEGLEAGDFSDRWRDRLNHYLNHFIDGSRDYLQLHYLLNSRSDTDYWRASRENPHRSDHLSAILEAWDSGVEFDPVLFDHINQHAFARNSWYCALAGMGRFPKTHRGLHGLANHRHRHALETNRRQAEAYWPHAEYLQRFYGEG